MKKQQWLMRLDDSDLKLEVSKKERQIFLFVETKEKSVGLLALSLPNARRVQKALECLIKQLENAPEDVVDLYPEQVSLFMTQVRKINSGR